MVNSTNNQMTLCCFHGTNSLGAMLIYVIGLSIEILTNMKTEMFDIECVQLNVMDDFLAKLITLHYNKRHYDFFVGLIKCARTILRNLIFFFIFARY